MNETERTIAAKARKGVVGREKVLPEALEGRGALDLSHLASSFLWLPDPIGDAVGSPLRSRARSAWHLLGEGIR